MRWRVARWELDLTTLPSSSYDGSRRRIHLSRRGQTLANRLGPQLAEYPAQHLNARRERVAVVVLDDAGKLLGESLGFGVGEFNVHGPGYGASSQPPEVRGEEV